MDAASGGRLTEPMRLNCSTLTEASVASGHFLMLERADDVNRLLSRWLAAKMMP